MGKGLLPIALGLGLVGGHALADVIVLPEGEPTPQISLPPKGTSMAEVLRRYGEPRNRGETVGGNSPVHPPITRWDYDGFVVIFERDKVIDGVIPGAPPPIVNRGGLERVEPQAPEPGATLPSAFQAPEYAPAPQAAAPDAPPPPEPAPAAEAPAATEPPAEKLEPQARESALPPQ